MTDAVVKAALPSAIAVLQAVKEFVVNLGTDPALVPVKLPGAVAVLIGTVELQFPALATAELAAVQTDVNAKIDGLIANLKAKAE